MARITVIGGSGYAGSNIVRDAASRGHQVTSISRSIPTEQVDGVTYTAGDAQDSAVLTAAVDSSDMVILAASPRGSMEGKVRGVAQALADLVKGKGVRLGVIGGAGSLLVAPGGPKVSETEGFPQEIMAEATEMADVLQDLRASDDDVDWFYVSPAGGFGAWVPGEHTGTFRLGGDVLVVDEDGKSEISGADFAQAVVDEVETKAHRRQRFTMGY